MELNRNMEGVHMERNKSKWIILCVFTTRFYLKISISILVPYKLRKTKTESFAKPMQCTKKDHLTDTALPSKSIPCSRAAQWRETSPA